MKCMKNKGLEKHTRGKTQGLGWNPSGFEVQREKKVFARWKDTNLSRENERNEFDFGAKAI